jgi:fatty acid desaturase
VQSAHALPNTAPATSGTPARLPRASSFTALTQEVHDLGLLRRRYDYYWAKLLGAVLVLVMWVATFVRVGDSWWQLGTALALAVIMTQIAFLGHDAAHRQIFRSASWNDWTSLVVANLMVGISYGWWQHKHTRHHATPNKHGSDPDIAAGALALTPDAMARIRTPLARWVVSTKAGTSSPSQSWRACRCTGTVSAGSPRGPDSGVDGWRRCSSPHG